MGRNRRGGHDDRDGRDLRARAFSWYWQRIARQTADPARLNNLVLARRAELDELAQRTEGKIVASRLERRAVENAIWVHQPPCLTEPLDRPAVTQPASGIAICSTMSLYHDDTGGVYTITQRPDRSAAPVNRFEIFFESYEFLGSYLSFAFRVPDQLRRPVHGERIVLSADFATSRIMKGFARLNIQGATGTDTLYAEAELGHGKVYIGFDFSFASFAVRQNDAIWIDLIVDRPRMVEFSLRSIALSLLSKDQL
jgi:hypothetical protein